METLRELTAEYLELQQMLMDEDTDPQCIQDTMEGIAGEIELKADSYAMIIASLEAKQEMIDAEVSRLKKISKRLESNVGSLKKNLQSCMVATGKVKFKTDFYSFGIQKNPPSLVIDDESKVPIDYWIPQPAVIDKDSIKKLIKDGTDISYAHLEQGESLRIR